MLIELDSDLDQDTADTIDEALRFFASKLLPEGIIEDLKINVDFNPAQHQYAVVYPEDDDNGLCDLSTYRLILKNKKKRLIESLAHEMVHIKQYALGELQYYTEVEYSDTLKDINMNNNISHSFHWMGEEWLPEEDDDEEFDSPWEIEAYGREYGLMAKWNKEKKNK